VVHLFPDPLDHQPMRLSPKDKLAIEQAARECFPPGSTVLLFGSRLDDTRRGGDIDLLVEPPAPLAPRDLVEQRNRFIARIYRLAGERRIDVLIVPAGVPDDRPVIQVARRQGRVLTQVPQ
jgi:predicted nucleotidyltransferase